MDSRDRSTRLILAAILALAFALRLAHWEGIRDEPFFSWLAMDSQEYDRWAREVAAGDWLGSQVFSSEERRVGKEGRYRRDWSSDVCSSDLSSGRPWIPATARPG